MRTVCFFWIFFLFACLYDLVLLTATEKRWKQNCNKYIKGSEVLGKPTNIIKQFKQHIVG